MPIEATVPLDSPRSALGRLASSGLAAATALTVTVEAYVESFHAVRVGIVLILLIVLHLVRFPRIVFTREAFLYFLFLAYMALQLLWTDDRLLALNTLAPASNFVLVLILFGSLLAFHDLRSVLTGSLLGFLLGALFYTRASGFPIRYPAEFSYNAIALMYLFGLFCALLLASLGRWRRSLLLLAVAVTLCIVATTSIKTNLGVVLGAIAAGVSHFRHMVRLVRRNALVLLALVALLAYAIASNETVVEALRRGTERVALGVDLLQARENLPGYSAFEERSEWQREGFRGWSQNPVFGHGVEAFRGQFGITSHTTPVDLLYNSGAIGLALFYSVLVSLLLRLYRARRGGLRESRAVIFGGTVCFLFITLSGTMHYSAILAAFVAMSVALLRRDESVPRTAAGAAARC